jgi:CRP/FNR family cyclic AMP-dependent transcriptional regulator
VELRRQPPTSFLEDLSPATAEKVLAVTETFGFAAGDIIFSQGDESKYLYIIKAGEVGVEIQIPLRGERTILTLAPGDVSNWSALIEPYVSTASVRALRPTTVLGISGKGLREACLADASLGFEVYRALACAISARLVAIRLQLLEAFARPYED